MISFSPALVGGWEGKCLFHGQFSDELPEAGRGEPPSRSEGTSQDSNPDVAGFSSLLLTSPAQSDISLATHTHNLPGDIFLQTSV